MKTLTTFLLLLFCVSLMAAECNDDEDSDDSVDADGYCKQEVAGMPCGDDCMFDPAEIDCQKACENINEVCKDPACADDCQNLQQNAALCKVGCDGTKTLSCTNLTFGCYASSTDCVKVGNCINDHF